MLEVGVTPRPVLELVAKAVVTQDVMVSGTVVWMVADPLALW